MGAATTSARRVPRLLMAGGEIRAFRRRILDWFARNRRDLPWRLYSDQQSAVSDQQKSRPKTNDPYAIWVSEAMLQQTRVETAIPYYQRFMKRFPTLASLAKAEWEEVAAHWAGLGYYARARNLHRAAREIIAQHGGRIPEDYQSLLRLPGIGSYIAGAIASIAYGHRVPALDGNAKRVLSRYFALAGDPRRPPLDRDLLQRAAALVPPRAAGAFNEALMELGATVCTPRRPNCPACPLAGTATLRSSSLRSTSCRALARDEVHLFPQASPSSPVPEIRATVVAVFKNGRVLLRQRPPEGLWGGLWEIPQFEGRRPLGAVRLMDGLRRRFGIEVQMGPIVGRVRHALSHRRIVSCVRACHWRGGRLRGLGPSRARWVPLRDAESYPISAYARKILAVLTLSATEGWAE